MNNVVIEHFLFLNQYHVMVFCFCFAKWVRKCNLPPSSLYYREKLWRGLIGGGKAAAVANTLPCKWTSTYTSDLLVIANFIRKHHLRDSTTLSFPFLSFRFVFCDSAILLSNEINDCPQQTPNLKWITSEMLFDEEHVLRETSILSARFDEFFYCFLFLRQLLQLPQKCLLFDICHYR